jgi:AFG3 family protein
MTEETKNESSKKQNSNNIPPMGDDNQPRLKPKFNIYWLYAIVFTLIMGYSFFRGSNSTGFETDQIKFTEMLKNGDVEKIKTIRNKKIVRVFLNKDSIAKRTDFYKKIATEQKFADFTNLTQPQLFFNIVEDKTFADQMMEFYKANPTVAQVADSPDDEGEIIWADH